MYSLKPADNNPQQPGAAGQQPAQSWTPPPQQDAGTGGWKFPVLLVGVLALAGSNVYQYTQMTKVKEDVVKVQKSLQDEIATVKETSAVSTQTYRSMSILTSRIWPSATRRADESMVRPPSPV